MPTKYKVKGTNILHNKKLYPEGSQIELEDKDAKKLLDYLVPVQEMAPETTNNTVKTTSKTSKTTNKNNPKTTPKEAERTATEAKETEGGEE